MRQIKGPRRGSSLLAPHVSEEAGVIVSVYQATLQEVGFIWAPWWEDILLHRSRQVFTCYICRRICLQALIRCHTGEYASEKTPCWWNILWVWISLSWVRKGKRIERLSGQSGPDEVVDGVAIEVVNGRTFEWTIIRLKTKLHPSILSHSTNARRIKRNLQKNITR